VNIYPHGLVHLNLRIKHIVSALYSRSGLTNRSHDTAGETPSTRVKEIKILLLIHVPSPTIWMKSSRPNPHPRAGIDPSMLRSSLNVNYKRKEEYSGVSFNSITVKITKFVRPINPVCVSTQLNFIYRGQTIGPQLTQLGATTSELRI
jgi:hypothetical protein